MRHIIALSFLYLCLSAWAHADSGTALDDHLDQAHTVYNEHYSTSPPGTYENGNVLFVIVELSTEEPSERAMRGRVMLASNKAIRAYAIAKYPPPDDLPPKPPLIALFPSLLPLLQAVDPKMGVCFWQETWQYKGTARILQNEARESVYRYVVALPLDELKNAILEVQRSGPDEPAIELALRTAWASLAADGKLAAICSALSLPEDRLRLANNELCRHVNANSLCWGAFSPRGLQAAERRLIAFGASPALGTLKGISGGMPVSARALTDWANSGDAPPWSSLNVRLLSLDDEDVRPAVLEQISMPDESPAGKYAAWLSVLATRPLPELISGVVPGPVTMAAWRTLGHANFPNVAPDTETPEYREAKELYDAGRELPRLAKLLVLSIEKSPRHTPSWVLLGNSLRADRAPEDAVWALAQALRLSPDNTTARASLALAYQETDQTEWAAGMAASVLAFPEASAWSRKQAERILESLNHKGEKP